MKTYHKASYCDICRHEMIVCKTCKNPCCNGTYGRVNEEECPDCPDAYDVQRVFWHNADDVEFCEEEA